MRIKRKNPNFFVLVIVTLVSITSNAYCNPEITAAQEAYIKSVYAYYRKKYEKYRADDLAKKHIENRQKTPDGRKKDSSEPSQPEDDHKKDVSTHEISEGFHSIKLYGNATMEYYYVNAYVGTPPQR